MLWNKWRIALRTTLLVVGVVLAKVIVHHYGWDAVQLNALFSSIIAGGVFIVSIILAGTLSDYKESEKIPAEMVASLESIDEEGQRVRALSPAFNLPGLRATLLRIVESFHRDLADQTHATRECVKTVGELGASFSEMEACGLAPNYIVRLKTEQGNLRKLVLRVYHIQRTGFIPSAYVLVEGIICLIIILLIMAQIEHLFTALIELAFISYIFIYLVTLLRAIDTPFRANESTMDDISRFLLKEFAVKMQDELNGNNPVAPAGVQS